MKMKRVIFSLVFFISILFSKENEYKIMSVSDYSYTMGGKQSVSITIGKSEREWFSITIHRDQIEDGNMILRDPGIKEKVIDATGAKDGISYYYLIRGSYPTIFFNIIDLNKKEKVAKVVIEIDLYNTDIQKYIRLKNSMFIFKGKNFEKLTMSLKNSTNEK